MNLEQIIFEKLRTASTPKDFEQHLAYFLSSRFYVWTDGSLVSGRQLVDVVGRLKIEIYSREHAPPHFHVVTPGIDAVFDINTCELLKGSISRRERDLVVYWHARAKDNLVRVWNATRPFNCPVGPVKQNAHNPAIERGLHLLIPHEIMRRTALHREGVGMARYKPMHKGLKLLPVDFDQQVIPGSFEHALCHLVDHELDLAEFHARYNNDDEGAPAFDPAALIKIILLAYSRGIISSRKMETACRENVLFIAVSGDSHPHFTTLAAFVSEMGDGVASLFAQVLLVCDRQGLIGREMFAIDGVKLPSNASKQKSGTRADYQRQLDKMEAATQKMIAQQKNADTAPTDEALVKRESLRLERLHTEACQLRDWLTTHPEDRKGAKGAVRLSNRTDNGSAKMATSKGAIQGYTGVAAVDEKTQIIVAVQASGTGSEQELLLPIVKATAALRTPETVITADAGYHSEANLQALAETSVDAYVPDNGYRKRDARYADQAIHTAKPDPLWNKAKTPGKAQRFTPQDIQLAEDRTHCTCPAGKRLYGKGSNCTCNGFAAIKFRGAEQDCLPCARRHACLRTPEKTKTRQVAFFQGKRPGYKSFTDRMKTRIDSDTGRHMITRRFATVEPVFGNLRGNKQLCRFSLRGQQKVDGQWKLYCLMHNIEKLAHHGLGGESRTTGMGGVRGVSTGSGLA